MHDGKVDQYDIPEIVFVISDTVNSLPSFQVTSDVLPVLIKMLYNFIVDTYNLVPADKKADFERMVDTGYRTWFKDMSYAEFLEWNNKCICELTNEEDAWLVGLCRRLKNKHIQLQDMECCSRFEAYGFYFNEKKHIVIVNPR
jgi:hypothetical protein